MINSRIKNIEGIEGIKQEAIATTVTILYNAVSPLDTVVNFAYQDFLRKEDGEVTSFANSNYDLISLKLKDILEWDLGNEGGALGVLSAIRVATDLAHNKRAEANVPVS